MKDENKNIVIKVEPLSIAEELGIEPGDAIIAVNDKPVEDVFDYRYLINDEYIELTVKTKQGEICVAEIEKDYDEDLGIVFESGLMDDAKSCCNKCVFCFIDQLPKGMRETLYFKDDDTRLSFLQGNYVTMTNMKDSDIDRIIFYHLSPINISVHTANMELRKKMLNNRFADKILDIMKRLGEAGITMNLQIVLCPDINDKEELEYSLGVLSEYIPMARSLSVVPVGITKYREGLYPMRPFTKEECGATIDLIEKWQKKLKEKYDTRFVFASDEFYIGAEREIPPISAYEDFPQIENGVGMIALLLDETGAAIKKAKAPKKERHVSLATGEAAYKFIKQIAEETEKKFKNVKVDVYCIKNNFFGGKITVSGLLTGTDIIDQLKDKPLGECLILPGNLLRDGEETLLDDFTLDDLRAALSIDIKINDKDGAQLIDIILGNE